MRDELSTRKPWKHECGIVNLQKSTQSGSHWVAYKKRGDYVEYFDSFGNLQPPRELKKYFDGSTVIYNCVPYQDFGTFNCGHLCLQFLYKSK